MDHNPRHLPTVISEVYILPTHVCISFTEDSFVDEEACWINQSYDWIDGLPYKDGKRLFWR